MSRDGQAEQSPLPVPRPHPEPQADSRATVTTRPLAPGASFARHTHTTHQIAWAMAGVLEVSTAAASWVLPPTRALWIPAGLPHETGSAGPATTLRSVYLRTEDCPVAWASPRPILARPLLAELIGYLNDEDLRAERRARAEALLLDLLEPVAMHTVELRTPTSGPARQVATELVCEPGDSRTLEEWGHAVGASGRTLARAFQAETGVPFGRWRTRARMQAALPMLAEGMPVGRVAVRVGYESASAFVAAFRRETGLTPAAYFRGR
jgi:AraC-like DNA-binding protein/quercetin dioxygenase-like cupin family protein